MKFNCGKTWKEKKADLEEWHLHFAWLPVRVGPRDCRWLEWVMRQGTWRPNYYRSCWTWEYRAR